MEAAAMALPLPDDALAEVLARLPAHTLAASRCVCKAWLALIDARGLLLPHLLPHDLRGIFINFRDYWPPLFLARPTPALPRIRGDIRCDPIIDHCNGLLLCGKKDYLVINPATRRWDQVRLPRKIRDAYVPDHVPYLVFDPAVSPHYEVFLFPLVPEKPEPVDPMTIPSATVNLNGFFSDDDIMVADGSDEEEEDEEYLEELESPLPQPSLEAGYFPLKRLSLSARWRMGEPEDTYGSMEWPPSPCILHVFSSSTRRWEERTFVREGVVMGTVRDMRLASLSWRPRWRYGVYWQQALYIHCRGGFVMRLPLITNNKYHVIKTPVDVEDRNAQFNLGKSLEGVCFVRICPSQLRVWVLNESGGQMEWALKHDIDLDHSALWERQPLRFHHGTTVVRPWILMDNINGKNNDNNMLPEGQSEWDSDVDDGLLHYEDEDEYFYRAVDFLAFHPYKEVVFLMVSSTAVAYHLKTSKIQWLGESYPKDYDSMFKGIYEAFPYTPCLMGDLRKAIV